MADLVFRTMPAFDGMAFFDHKDLLFRSSFEKFKTKKGVYVVCEDKVFLIHDAYLEKGGRAFLLGASKEFSRSKAEEVRQLRCMTAEEGTCGRPLFF